MLPRQAVLLAMSTPSGLVQVTVKYYLSENLFLHVYVRGDVEQKQVEERCQYGRFVAITDEEQRGRMVLIRRCFLSTPAYCDAMVAEKAVRTHQKYDAVLMSAYNGTMNNMRTMSKECVSG